MQAPSSPLRAAQDLPSPDSDQDFVTATKTTGPTTMDMVTLPSSPSSLFTGSPGSNNACPAAMQLPTPATPSRDDDDATSHIAEQELTPMIVPAKRGYKSHVPSACVNCKRAHLACDVSRPCKRCVSAGKADSCQDVKHKKRGRPRLHETKRLGSVYGGSMILDDAGKNGMMYGMIQTPTFTVATSVVRRDNPRPQTTSISFIHEPIEAFREQDEQRHRKKDASTTSGSRSQQALRDPEPPPGPSLSTPSPLNQSLKSPAHQAQMRLSCGTSCATAPKQCIATENRTTITLFLSMEMCCARASDEVTDLWGYHPQDLVHRSLYELISTHDTDRLGRLHRLLLDNVMDVARQHDNSIGPDERPPPAERTSSPLFYETDPENLVAPATGSSTFSDTLHIKKKTDDHELYEMLVYLGGGLGADLSTPATLNKLYMVAELRKHEYKVNSSNTTSVSRNAAGLPASLSFDRSRLFSPSVHSSPSSTSSSSTRTRLNSNNGSRSREYSFGRMGSGGLQARQGTLPSHFAANSQLNTVSLPPSRKMEIPKINIAPMTGKKRSTVPGVPYFRPIAAAGSNNSGSRGPLPPVARESTNPYSTLAYRFASITSGNKAIGPPRGGPPSYTHPTTQYFLQTSSSTLNAAASAAQSSSRAVHSTAIDTMANNDKAVGKTDSNRKAEMSIRSLLC